MRCHQCHQDNIKIELGHITCDICGLDIDISWNLEDKLVDLFVYNKQLEEAETLGSEAYIEGKGNCDNPYSLEADEIMLNKRWEEGFDRERIAYEKEAFSSSVEKLNDEMIKMVRKEGNLEERIVELKNESEEFQNSSEKWRLFIVRLSKTTYIWGKKYRQHMFDFFNGIDSLNNPDD